jgi:hypothetical protein
MMRLGVPKMKSPSTEEAFVGEKGVSEAGVCLSVGEMGVSLSVKCGCEMKQGKF